MIIDTPNGPKEISDKEYMKAVIRSAWEKYDEIAAEEEEGDYGDAMLSMERTHAEGFAEGLGRAYYMFYKESYDPEHEEK